MKKIIALLALMALVPGANAGDLTTSAEFRLRYQLDQDQDGNADAAPSSTNSWDQRFKMGFTYRASEKLTGQVTALHNAQWGHTNLGIGGTGDSLGETNGIGNAENMLLVNEAYGSWMATDELLIRFGRGSLGMGDGRVISTNDWEATPYSFEGALFTYDKEFARFNVYGVRFADGFTRSGGMVSDPEINSYGFNMDLKTLPSVLKMVNFHIIQVNKDALTAGNSSAGDSADKESRLRYGLVVSGDVANFDYRATYAAHMGEYTDIADNSKLDREGSMMDMEFGFTMPNVMNSRISLLYHSDTGTSASSTKDETYDSYFYEKHENAGWMDIFGWGNLTYMQLGYSMDFNDELNLHFQYIMFSQTEKDGSIVGGHNGDAFKGAGKTDEDALGSEIDLALTKKYDGGLSITARAGIFTPGDEYKDVTDDAYNQFFLEAKMMF